MMSSLETQQLLDNALELAIKDLQVLSLEPEEKANPLDFNNSADRWADFFVNEMMQAGNLDDARNRASKTLEAFVCSMNAKHKESEDKLMKENGILKRAVIIQHQRHPKEEDESKKMKKLVLGYEEQLKALEVKNYALSLHLKQAVQQENRSIPQRFPPDVF